MKKMVFTLALILTPVAFASSAEETIEIVRSSAEVPMTLNLNEKTVRCLWGDYGASSLKISVPELRSWTIFRQTTRGETDPCINAGACRSGLIRKDGLDPSMILNPEKPTEDVTVKVVLTEVLQVNHEARSCHRRLFEKVSTRVRGMDFAHGDGGDLGDLDYETCMKMADNAKH